MQFFIVLDESLTQDLPFNIPISNESIKYSDQDYILSDIVAGTNNRHSLIQSLRNYWQAQNNKQTVIPYFPYFSNCDVFILFLSKLYFFYKGFDLFIPFISLTELHPECVLIEEKNTVPIYPFDFGRNPVSDTCSNVKVYCTLDESLFNTNLWILLDSQSVFFKLTSDPQTLNDSKRNVYDDSNVLLKPIFVLYVIFVLIVSASYCY